MVTTFTKLPPKQKGHPMGPHYHVYLAGPIAGTKFKDCVDWRKHFVRHMPPSITCLSPMRGKEACFSNDELIEPKAYDDHVLATDEGILSRDFFDCHRADLIVVNLKGATRVSIGTVMEIAWGHARKIPMVFIMEEEGNLHDHPMIRAARSFRVDGANEAFRLVRTILDVPYTTELEPLRNDYQ